MSDIIFKEKKNIAILTLNREKTLNAWNSKMRKQICNIFSKIKKKKHIKAINSILYKLNLNESNLECGFHFPLNKENNTKLHFLFCFKYFSIRCSRN